MSIIRVLFIAVASAFLIGTSAAAAQSASSRRDATRLALTARMAEAAMQTQKVELADKVLALREQRNGRVFSRRFREGWVQKLAKLPLDQLEVLAQGDGATADLVALTSDSSGQVKGNISAASIEASSIGIGSTDSDMVFTKVPPCRVVDTRHAGGPISGGGGYRHFIIAGEENFQYQGGLAGGCGIPYGATAVAVNLVVVSPAGSGWLRAFPWGSAPPTASVINFTAASGALANGYITALCDPWRVDCGYDLTVLADAAGTHILLDVMGYFSAPFPTALDVTTFVNSQFAAPGANFLVIASCPAGRTVTGGGFYFFTAATGVSLWQNGPDLVNGNGWVCGGGNGSALADTFYCTAQCSRLPGWE